MLAISECSKKIFYLQWIPSESGPLLSKFGSFPIDVEGNFEDKIKQVINEVNEDPVRIHFSMDQEDAFFSQSNIINNSGGILEWQLNQRFDKSFKKNYETFHYRTLKKDQFFDIHISKIKKNKIIDAIKLLKIEIRSINLGIFSAEIGARQWFKAYKYNSYLVWRMGKGSTDQILSIKEGKFESLTVFKRTKKNIKFINAYGDLETSKVIVKNIFDYIFKDLNEISDYEKVYVYKTTSSINDIKRIFGKAGSENLVLLNPFSILETSTPKQINIYNGTMFAETGLAFRGIDV